MNILSHFDRSNNSKYVLYRLKKRDWTKFINKLPDEFRKNYISDTKLGILSRKAGIAKQSFLEKYVIPDNSTINSGDFGEMLCYFLVIENFDGKGIELIGPRKWIWKDSKNKPAPGVDVILFHINNSSKPTTKDILVTIESKMKATYSNENKIQEAIDGATTDKLSRMAKTLSWLEEKYARIGREDKRKQVERFKDPASYGNFKKQHKAIIILDRNFEINETSKSIINLQRVTVIVFSIEDLKKAYENTRANILNSV